MAINKALRGARRSVMWEGTEAADVRGLSPHDVFGLLNEEGNGVKLLITAGEEFNVPAGADADRIAAEVMAKAPNLIATVADEMPRLIAKLIAIAADAPDESDHIQEHWPMALQFQALIEISALTFGGIDGFRLFVGNVLALAGVVKQMTAGAATGPRRTPTGFQPSEDGSET